MKIHEQSRVIQDSIIKPKYLTWGQQKLSLSVRQKDLT